MKSVDDLTSLTFGRWTVLNRDLETVKYGGRRPNYICQCECGTIKSIPRQGLTKGDSKSCGCLHKEIVSVKGLIDLSGQIFGRLKVIERDLSISNSKWHTTKWYCECECGNITSVASYPLTSGITVSCGCYHKERVSTHGGYGDRLYTIWRGIIARCTNSKSPAYENYGGRGISICDEWLTDINKFKQWALDNGYTDELTIERKDVNDNYCPDNVTFIPKSQQSKNRRNIVLLTAWNESKTFNEWLTDPRCIVKNLQTLKARYYRALEKNIKIEEILTKPER